MQNVEREFSFFMHGEGVYTVIIEVDLLYNYALQSMDFMTK